MDKEVGEDKPTQLFIKSSNMERSIAPVIWNTQNFISTQREKKIKESPEYTELWPTIVKWLRQKDLHFHYNRELIQLKFWKKSLKTNENIY